MILVDPMIDDIVMNLEMTQCCTQNLITLISKIEQQSLKSKQSPMFNNYSNLLSTIYNLFKAQKITESEKGYLKDIVILSKHQPFNFEPDLARQLMSIIQGLRIVAYYKNSSLTSIDETADETDDELETVDDSSEL